MAIDEGHHLRLLGPEELVEVGEIGVIRHRRRPLGDLHGEHTSQDLIRLSAFG